MIYGLNKLMFQDIGVWCRVNPMEQETMDHIIARGCFEIKEHRDEVFSLPHGARIFDVGAHIGTYSILVKKRRPDFNVILFEPEPENFGMAVKNCMLNHVNVVAMQYAIAPKDGWITLNGYEGNTGGWSILPRNFGMTRTMNLPVTGVTVETICNRMGFLSPTFIKIDVEGAEHAILPSLSDRILDNIMGFDVDFHPPNESIKQTVAYMESKGFKIDWTNRTKSLLYKERWWE